jgi:uncharacterized protein YbaP (TraB family)
MRQTIKLITFFLIACILNSDFATAQIKNYDNPKCDKQSKTTYQPIKNRLNAIFYEAINCETGKTAYIVGTFHTSDMAILQKIAYVKPYLKQADAAWFEMSLTAENAKIANQMMMIPVEKPDLSKQLNSNQFKQLVALFQRKNPTINAEILKHYKPWAAAIALQILEIEVKGAVMDDVLQKAAIQAKIEVNALEKAEDQLSIFDNLSNSQQLQMLNESINNYEMIAKLSKQLIQAYKAGNLHEIHKIASDSFTLGEKNLNNELKQKLIVERNLAMGKKLLSAAVEDNLFIAIGALHLSGDTGLLNQFEQNGYFIYPIKY